MLCKCGKKISKYSSMCRKCHKESWLNHAAEFLRIRDGGKCPWCGRKLIPNISLAGSYWLQCEGLGRNKPNPTDPDCNFQILAGVDEVREILAKTERN
jgi:NAD-dependent SIR2 family protein deacetylase